MLQGLKAIVDLVFPPVCHICGHLLPPGEKYICQPCKATLPRTLYHRDTSGTNPMEHRFAGIVPFRRATGVFFYVPGSPLSQTVQDFKYRKFPGLARYMGRLMGEELFPTGFFSDVDMIIPVPIHFSKRMHRGYNQSEMLALGIRDISGTEMGTYLKARRPHRTQTSLSHESRKQLSSDIFHLKNPHIISGRHILIVDDI